ncbi:MAG: signal peptide peptidase SppA [Acidobacteriota bacterium]|nr:signal peptide peptidase SppA [Acidobacteriota bacterium]
MKNRRYVVWILLFFFLLAVAAIVSFLYFDVVKRPVQVRAHSYLEIDLGGEIQEIVPADFLSSLLPVAGPLAMNDLWMNIRKAKKDDRIDALFLRLNLMLCDWAKVNEIREAILDFRKSGKKAYAYIEEAPDFDKEYYLATACDRIILHPLGWLGINGIGGYIPFFKNSLDKLGIQAEFEHVEEYKTAYNSFTEKGMTPAHRGMMESIYGDLFDQYVETAAGARGMTGDEYKTLIHRAFFQGENAKSAGLVDELLFEDEALNMIRGRGPSLHRIEFDEYTRVRPSSLGMGTGRKIALIYGIGPILSGESTISSMGSATVARWIRRARQDKSIAAIVFRVDSPGGSSVASDVIWRETFLAKKEKPFVVSMSDVAGSGGYWISMAAHKIIAQPETLTGSIGVLAGKISMAGLYEKLGVTTDKLVYGDKADVFSTFRGFTPEERKILKDEILWTYDKFLTKAAEGRNLTKEEVDRSGKGRVWTGRQALDLKLIDGLGGLSEAIEAAKKLAGIPAGEDVRLVVWPRKRSLWSAFLGRGGDNRNFELPRDADKALATLRLMQKNLIWALMPFAAEPR